MEVTSLRVPGLENKPGPACASTHPGNSNAPPHCTLDDGTLKFGIESAPLPDRWV